MEISKQLSQNSYGFKVFQQLPTPEELRTYYEQKYYQNPQGTYKSTYSNDELVSLKFRMELLTDFIEAYLVQTTGLSTFLDVGCGEGYVLSHFKSIGYDVRGLDFSSHGVRKKNPELEDYITQGDIYESLSLLAKSGSTFDVIFVGNVLEHVLNPTYLLDLIKMLMRDTSLLCITVPNDFSNFQKFLINRKFVDAEYWVAFPDHLSYFEIESLRTFVESNNLEVIDQFCDFPIEWFLVNKNSNYVRDKEKGKEAHKARTLIDFLINSSSNKQAKMDFWRSLSKLGFGRTISVILRKC